MNKFGMRNQRNVTTTSGVYSNLFTLSKPSNHHISSLLGSHDGGEEQKYKVTDDPESGTNIELRPMKPDTSASVPSEPQNKTVMFEQMKNRLINIVSLKDGKDKKIDSLLADMKSFFITEDMQQPPEPQVKKKRNNGCTNVGETLEKMLSKKTEACR